MKLKIELIVDLGDEVWGLEDKSAKEWFVDEVLDPETLILHSNAVGDSLGRTIEIRNWTIIPND